MIKREELSNVNSCLNRAKDDELVFVLLGRDACAPAAIRTWAAERVRVGKNTWGDAQIIDALACIAEMSKPHALSLSSPIEPNVATTLLRKWRDYAEEMRKGKAWIVSAESRDLLKLQVEMAERFIRDLETL